MFFMKGNKKKRFVSAPFARKSYVLYFYFYFFIFTKINFMPYIICDVICDIITRPIMPYMRYSCINPFQLTLMPHTLPALILT